MMGFSSIPSCLHAVLKTYFCFHMCCAVLHWPDSISSLSFYYSLESRVLTLAIKIYLHWSLVRPNSRERGDGALSSASLNTPLHVYQHINQKTADTFYLLPSLSYFPTHGFMMGAILSPFLRHDAGTNSSPTLRNSQDAREPNDIHQTTVMQPAFVRIDCRCWWW